MLYIEEPKVTTQPILKSECEILECMANLFCNDLKQEILDLINKYNENTMPQHLEDVSKVVKNILCGYTMKEEAIANIIEASAREKAVKLGINPCSLKR